MIDSDKKLLNVNRKKLMRRIVLRNGHLLRELHAREVLTLHQIELIKVCFLYHQYKLVLHYGAVQSYLLYSICNVMVLSSHSHLPALFTCSIGQAGAILTRRTNRTSGLNENPCTIIVYLFYYYNIP